MSRTTVSAKFPIIKELLISPSNKTFITVAAVTTLTLVVGYAAYFDYKRRNDAAFRKRLRECYFYKAPTMF